MGKAGGLGDGLDQRLGAVLVADAVGYSRLIAVDDRATVEALDIARGVFKQTVEHARGRVVDMAGDAVLAIFDTARGAVEAAIAAQKRIEAHAAQEPEDRRLRFRIGIHLGDVIQKIDGTVYGDGVNIAARLQAIAEPGGITVSDAIRGAVGVRLPVVYDDVGEQQVKNIPTPVRAFHLIDARLHGARLPASSWARRSISRAWVVGLLFAGMALAGGALYVRQWKAPAAAPATLSAAVLPFAATSDAHRAVAKSFSDALAHELGKMRMAAVFASGSTAGPLGESSGLPAGLAKNRARYSIDGELRAVGDQTELVVRLVESASGLQSWSERFEVSSPASPLHLAWLQARLANRVRNACITPHLIERPSK